MAPARIFTQLASRPRESGLKLVRPVAQIQYRALRTTPLLFKDPPGHGPNEDPTVTSEDAKEPNWPKGSRGKAQKSEDKSPEEAQQNGSGSKGGPSTSGATGHYKNSGDGAATGGDKGPMPPS